MSGMSSEKNLIIEENTPSFLETTQKSKKVTSGRVDINTLLNRARKERKKEFKKSFVFFGLFVFLILVVGILLSL
tara:strand:+ start:357 stop:581 length:225 start_codon:yes stop_codon:yes gene_type:complete